MVRPKKKRAMFNKMKEVAGIFAKRVEETPRYRPPTVAPSRDEIESAREGERPRPRNPAIGFIEGAVSVGIAVYLITPLVSRTASYFSAGHPKSLLVSIATLSVFALWNRLGDVLTTRVARIVRLDFLDPYVGRRLKRTIKILKSWGGRMPADNGKTKAVMQVVVTLITMAVAFLVLAGPKFLFPEKPPSIDLEKAAIGWIGFIMGYWLS
jgi:hypothetical protein